MDNLLEHVNRRVLDEARGKGRDSLSQIELAVRALCVGQPDMTAWDALAAVEMVRNI